MTRRFLRNFDYPLLLLTIALILFGLAMIRSAEPPGYDFFGKQLMWAGAGLVLMGFTALFDYRHLANLSRPLYVLIVVLLSVIFFLGKTSFGAQRWFSLIFFDLQPAELAKLVLILVLAKYLGDREGKLSAFATSLVIVGIPMGLIFAQPNLSTTIVLAVVWFGIAFVAGLPLRLILFLGLLAVAALAGAIWGQLLQPYQIERLTIFLNPLSDPTDAGYNLIQSRIAIGSGGLLGQGYGYGSQSQLGYLLVRHTDFIASVIAEELGFVGMFLLILLLMFMIFRLLRVAEMARDPFGRLVVTGVATLILFQAFGHLGVNLGLLPPTGLSLPFVSYGGSSLLTLLMSVGIVQSIVIRHKKLEFD
jgi:rod shape determining protein RodA